MANKGIIFRFSKKVDKVENHSLLANDEITKLSAYPAYSEVEGLVTTEAAARAEADGQLNTAIGSEATARAEADTTLQGRATALETAVGVLNGDDATAGSVAKSVKDAVAAETTRATGVEGGLQDQIDAINTAMGDGESGDGNSLVDRIGALETGLAAETTARGDADTALQGRATALEGDVATLKGDATTAGSVAKAVADEAALRVAGDEAIDARLDVIEGSGEGSVAKALADAKAYTDAREVVINAEVATKAVKTEVDTALAARYTKTEAEAMVDGKISTAVASLHDFKGQVADMAALNAIQNPKTGDVYNVVTATNGTSAEYFYNGTGWEEFGTVIDMTGYATKQYADNAVAAEATRATGIEGGLRTDVDAANAAITVINGSGEGSITKAVADEATIARAAEQANAAAIATLNGNDTTAGSVAKAVKDAVDAEAARATGVEGGLDTRLTTVEGVASANTAAVAVLNGTDAEAGSVAKTVKDAVAAEAAIARAAEGANADAIAVLNGDATTAGSVAKAVKDAVDAEAATARAAEQANAAGIVALQNRAAALEGASSYEFINLNTTKMLESKFYIVRNASLTATLPTGDAAVGAQIRIMLNDAASKLGGSITPTGEDTINGLTNQETGAALPFALDEAMDITLLYDADNNDWVVLAIMN